MMGYMLLFADASFAQFSQVSYSSQNLRQVAVPLGMPRADAQNGAVCGASLAQLQ